MIQSSTGRRTRLKRILRDHQKMFVITVKRYNREA